MSHLDLSLDDCLDLLGAGRNHKARLELEALRTAYATVQAERDAARADVRRLIEQNEETTREWGEDVTRLRAELATLRETLVGELEAERNPHGPSNCTLCEINLVCHEQWMATAHNAALDRAITIIRGAP